MKEGRKKGTKEGIKKERKKNKIKTEGRRPYHSICYAITSQFTNMLSVSSVC